MQAEKRRISENNLHRRFRSAEEATKKNSAILKIFGTFIKLLCTPIHLFVQESPYLIIISGELKRFLVV